VFQQKFYPVIEEKKIMEDIKREGFNPLRFSNALGFVYYSHRHQETKLLVFLEGSMEVKVEEETYQCGSGDKLIIPGNMEHSAIVGSGGCVFFWAEK